MGFLCNVLASIVAGIILLVGASIFSKRMRRLLISILSHLLDIDIDYVFPNKKETEDDLENEIDKAQFVYVFAGRGNELQRDPFNSLFLNRNKNIPTKILLPKTGISENEYDWLMQREKELEKFDRAHGAGLLHQQVDNNANFINRYTQDPKVELRRYNHPNIGRIIITDRCVFYTPYKENAHGRHSRVYKFRKNGEIYYNFLRLFNQLWNSEQPTN